MTESIPDHQPPSSRLEPFQVTIQEMRSHAWPYRRIAQWLKEEHTVQISWEGVRCFCLYRGIREGKPNGKAQPYSPPTASPPKAQQTPQPEPAAKFTLDDNAPPTPVQRR